MISEKRRYRVLNVEDAKRISREWMGDGAGEFGLPEIDDRYHVWRVPVVDRMAGVKVGEVVIDARTGRVAERKSTDRRILKGEERRGEKAEERGEFEVNGNRILMGDAEEVLKELGEDCVDLVFTSPPYFNARVEYADYGSYVEYLEKIRRVVRGIYRVLAEGRFLVMNTSPVLIRRAKRSESSRRMAVPFDLHRVIAEEGFDFVDDIIWVKPEGAGWATGRGRRFAADRHPLQYKAVPVTEYVLVYRKHTEKLIDWNIRTHRDQEAVRASRIEEYEKTNVWRIKPRHSREHPAVFPVELARRVMEYYSFRGDVVLDPFAGIGTVGEAARGIGRKYVLVEIKREYVEIMRERAEKWEKEKG